MDAPRRLPVNKDELNAAMRTLWLAIEASGGTICVEREVIDNYPGDKVAVINSQKDIATGDLILKSERDHKIPVTE